MSHRRHVVSAFRSVHMSKFQHVQKYLNASEYPISMETEIPVSCLNHLVRGFGFVIIQPEAFQLGYVDTPARSFSS